jgi:hypothetical protein
MKFIKNSKRMMTMGFEPMLFRTSILMNQVYLKLAP